MYRVKLWILLYIPHAANLKPLKKELTCYDVIDMLKAYICLSVDFVILYACD